MQRNSTIGELMERKRIQDGAKEYQGHTYMDLARFDDATKHMIIFDVLTDESPVGWKGERNRLYLSDVGYQKALDNQKAGNIKIISHAAVAKGNLYYDHRDMARYIVPRPNIILQLHRDLYSYAGSGGEYKNADNVIAETDAEGHQKARFIPVPAFQTAEAMDELCRQFLEAWNTDKIDRLLLIPMFILDFLCIHPFNDGNGRMSRLLSLLLYYKAGYIVGKYVSMEMLIEKTKETYYEALQASSTGWHENENSYEPFVKYYLGIMLKAYNEFESRVEHLKNRTLSKPERIKAMIDQKVGKITKKEIMDAHPDISKTTVERTLADLVKSEYIAKVGSGPATGYVKI